MDSLSVELEFAYEEGDFKRLVELLRSDPSQVNARTSSGSTLLHRATMRDDEDLAGHLLSLGAGIDAADAGGKTCLHQACYYGKFTMVLFLVQHGADIEAKDNSGVTPLGQAAGSQVGNRPRIAEYLLSCGATADLMTVIRLGRPDLVRKLIMKDPELIHRSPQSTPFLLEAIIAGSLEVAEILLEAGADANARYNSIWSPLSYVCHQQGARVPLDFVSSLLEHGANPDPDFPIERMNLVDWVRLCCNRPDIAKLLVRHGARRNIRHDR